jgi:ubiquinone/menaquinone biosynthesis C-methylase UbiE
MLSDLDEGYLKILEAGLSFWKAQALLTAVGLDIFSKLAERPMSREDLREALGLHGRGFQDFLRALVALEALNECPDGYANAPVSDYYLDRAKPTYIGGLLELAATRLYPLWGELRQALVTGEPQNEAKREENYYDNLCENHDRLAQFLSAMDGVSLRAAARIAEKFPWGTYQTFIDIGGARGALAVQLVKKLGHLTGGCFDLPAVRPYFNDYVRHFGLQERIQFYEGDFFRDPLPSAQVLILGHVLHNWNLDQRRYLIQKVYNVLPAGGGLIVYEWLSREERDADALVPLMSLNMLLATREGGGSSLMDCQGWMREAGFHQIRAEPLVGPCSMVVGLK